MADQLRAAAQQALEALKWHYSRGHSNTLGGVRLKIDEKALRDLSAALAQAEPVQDFRLTECVFVGPSPAPHEDWHHAISAMLREKHIRGLRISTATVDDWNGDKEQQRKPLTDEEILNIGKEARAIEGSHFLPVAFARAIERAHGIKEAK